jgi:hypothetical protein
MSYDVPTVAQFQARFPEIDAEETAIQIAIDDAADIVDTTWREKDFQKAILFLAAHYVTTGTAEAAGEIGDAQNIASESFGPISVSYQKTESGDSSNDTLGTTGYGRRYLELRRWNFTGPVVV